MRKFVSLFLLSAFLPLSSCIEEESYGDGIN
jgi:hypothetical protein